jgi:hypothetical protein
MYPISLRMSWASLWLILPFVRIVNELAAIKQIVTASGPGQPDTFQLWMMVEISFNVVLLDAFLHNGFTPPFVKVQRLASSPLTTRFRCHSSSGQVLPL